MTNKCRDDKAKPADAVDVDELIGRVSALACGLDENTDPVYRAIRQLASDLAEAREAWEEASDIAKKWIGKYKSVSANLSLARAKMKEYKIPWGNPPRPGVSHPSVDTRSNMEIERDNALDRAEAAEAEVKELREMYEATWELYDKTRWLKDITNETE